MNKKHWLWIAVVVLTAAMVSGCGWRRGRKADDFAAADLDPDWTGSIDFLGEEDFLDDRFGYTEVLDVRFEDVVFGFDSSQITSSEQFKADAVADYMQRNSGVKVIIEGHTCDIGSREYNMALGERRALAARAYLVQRGINSARIQTLSYGKENPLHFGDSEDARRRNRRAAFVLVR